MKKYVHLQNNIVTSIEDEFIDIFPGIPIAQRYSKEFLDNCIIVEEDVEVQTGMIYEDGVFREAPVVEVPDIPYPDIPDVQLTEFEQLKARADGQDAVIEEILFEIIPNIVSEV